MTDSASNSTPLWYRPVLRAAKTADDVLRAAKVLRYLSIISAVTAIVGQYIENFDEAPVKRGATQLSLRFTTNWNDFTYFLWSLTQPLALAGVLYASSFVLKNSVARLNLNLVLANEQARLCD